MKKKKRVIEVWASKKCHKRLNYRKGRYSLAHFWEKFKKVQNEGTIQNNIMSFDSSVFLGSGFHNPNYLEIPKFLSKISGF